MRCRVHCQTEGHLRTPEDAVYFEKHNRDLAHPLIQKQRGPVEIPFRLVVKFYISYDFQPLALILPRWLLDCIPSLLSPVGQMP